MRKLLLYGFIFSVLMNIFQLMYATKKFNHDSQTTEKYKKKIKDSIAKIVAEKEEGDYFSLVHNDKARDYFEDQDIDQLMPKIKEQLVEMNNNPKGNPLISYEGMVINKVRFLNHRWIIADFTGESGWGELILKYFVEPTGKVSFEPAEILMYPNT
ncbi:MULTISPECIES: hypothetical protein [Flavobacterium]|uniref:Hydrolase n=2 Tax=Flavobacterium TaxID=237 RepID=A0A437UES5_9FLAO|nr:MULTISPECIES: hypothetical protein [Flavobacterium]OWP82961.1 hypothetical protein BWK59_13050 [Flavobacterium davisii]QYS88657.1 hypothetical protein JJC05_13890 [Flavobacterium davisii]RVU92134.1 hypothetical protein EH230_01110 [Flavobacterium columnare]SPE78016.1 hypothetical protein FLACOL_02030 [Flavobacterium columnare]